MSPVKSCLPFIFLIQTLQWVTVCDRWEERRHSETCVKPLYCNYAMKQGEWSHEMKWWSYIMKLLGDSLILLLLIDIARAIGWKIFTLCTACCKGNKFRKGCPQSNLDSEMHICAPFVISEKRTSSERTSSDQKFYECFLV